MTRLSTGLTRERELAGARYLDDERLLGAYLLFYWPISYLQARGVLSELPRRPRTRARPRQRPGPAGLRGARRRGRRGDGRRPGRGRWPRPRELARLGRRAARHPRVEPDPAPAAGRAGRRRRAATSSRWATSLNELWKGRGRGRRRRAALLEEARALLAPGGSLVVIEPALRDTSRALLEVRDLLVARRRRGAGALPLPRRLPGAAQGADWCHAERPIDPPPLVAQIGKAAGLRKEAVKMSYLVLAPPGEAWAEPPPGRVFRIVSEPLAGKGRLRYMGCGPEGRMGLALQEKHVGDANRRFETLLRARWPRPRATASAAWTGSSIPTWATRSSSPAATAGRGPTTSGSTSSPRVRATTRTSGRTCTGRR